MGWATIWEIYSHLATIWEIYSHLVTLLAAFYIPNA
jgi:hypothetical protein